MIATFNFIQFSQKSHALLAKCGLGSRPGQNRTESGSGSNHVDTGWTFFFAGVVQGERWRAGVGLPIATQLSVYILEFIPVDEKAASLHLRVGDWVMTVVCAYAHTSNSECQPFLEFLGRLVEGAPGGASSQRVSQTPCKERDRGKREKRNKNRQAN